MSGLTANLIGQDIFQRFITNGTWVKPPGIKTVVIECIGGGGGGGGAHQSGAGDGGGGGGGGAIARMSFPAESLGDILTVTVGAETDGVAYNEAGEAGNFSTVTDDDSSKVILKAWGGGGGGGSSAE